jgi:hypothetical protein
MADGCRKCGAYVPPPALGKGGRPRVYCVECSPPGRRDRWQRPPSPYNVIALPAQRAAADPEPVELAARRRKPEPPREDEPQAASASAGARAVLDATQKALEEAQAAETAEGALALHLAGLLAAGGYTASGAAALAKALREAMTEALKSRPTSDALDELVRKRRDRMRGTG